MRPRALRASPRALPPALALLAACETEPARDARFPWWPEPRVAAPAPLLDALGVTPPVLAGPDCHRGPSLVEDESMLRAGFTRLAIGWETTCAAPGPVASAATAFGPVREPEAAVTVNGRGVALAGYRQLMRPSPGAAAAAEDSVVRRGLANPGARPLTCRMEGWPFVRYTLGGPEPTVRGWQTPEYQAIVHTYPASVADPASTADAASIADPAGAHVVLSRVSRAPFAACLPRRTR